MKIAKINRRLGLQGNNIEFTKEPFFGLQPGTKITQIGNGKENGTIRTDVFEQPLTYVGSVIVQFSKKEKMFAFQLDCKVDNENVYFLYGKTKYEIFTETGNKTNNESFMRFYKPEFKQL